MQIVSTPFKHPRSRLGNAPWLLTALVLFSLRGVVQAQFSYTTNNGAITITRYNGSGDSVAIPATTNGLPVTSIGNNAFYSSSLTNVTIPESVTTIGTNAFSACTSLTDITVDPSNPAYSSSNGVLFDKAQVTLIPAPAGLNGSYAIPNSVTSIGGEAFYQCFNLTSVIIPDSVASVGDHAFYQCTSLTGVTIPNGVTSIADYAFASCSRLTTVIVPNSLTTIGTDAFNSCYALTSVTIPRSVTILGNGAFSSCSSLTSAYFQGNAPHDTGGEFSGDPNATVYYLAGTTGWGAKFGGVSAVLWNPQSQAAGVATGRFGFWPHRPL
jgi:hypothetical protein